MSAQETLRSYLQRLRKDAGGISQAAAAKLVGTDRLTWVKWEAKGGGRGLSEEYAEKIARAFKRPVAELELYVTQPAAGLTRADREQLAEAVHLLAEVAPRFAAAVNQLEALLGERPTARAVRSRGRSER